MRRQLLDIDELQMMACRDGFDGGERKVRKMLMVDRVELISLDQALEVRELQRDHAVALEKQRHSGNKIIEIGNLGKDIVADDKVGPFALGYQPFCKRQAEELHQGGYTLLDGNGGDVGCRLYSQDGNAERGEMLQQIAVIAFFLMIQRLSRSTLFPCD